MTSPPDAGNHEQSPVDPTSPTADPDESFFTAADGWQPEQRDGDLAQDLASEVARAEEQEQDSEGSLFGSDALDTGTPTRLRQGIERDEEEDTLPPEAGDDAADSVEASGSSVDQGPSTRGSPRFTPENSRPASGLSIQSRQSPLSQPFDKRFHARKTAATLGALRNVSPAFLGSHSRQASYSSQITTASIEPEHEEQKPWEVIKWTKLKKLSSQAFSEAGRRAFGSRSYLVVGALIVIGTSKGLIMVFDYQQNLKSIIGQGSPGKCMAYLLTKQRYVVADLRNSTRMWTDHRDGCICRPYYHRSGALQRIHLYLGRFRTSEAFSHTPTNS